MHICLKKVRTQSGILIVFIHSWCDDEKLTFFALFLCIYKNFYNKTVLHLKAVKNNAAEANGAHSCYSGWPQFPAANSPEVAFTNDFLCPNSKVDSWGSSGPPGAQVVALLWWWPFLLSSLSLCSPFLFPGITFQTTLVAHKSLPQRVHLGGSWAIKTPSPSQEWTSVSSLPQRKEGGFITGFLVRRTLS